MGKARLNECRGINSSLPALKKCIRGLVQGKKFIPFRYSKLTLLLKDTLQGDCTSYMIACLSKASAQWYATKDTLEYGCQARMITISQKKKDAVQKKNMKEQLDECRKQNAELLRQIQELTRIVEEKDNRIKKMEEKLARRLDKKKGRSQR